MNILNFKSNSGGFFANCNIILSQIISYFNYNKKLPVEIKTHDAFTIYKTNKTDKYKIKKRRNFIDKIKEYNIFILYI
jgi:hypothetical protein